MVYLFDANVLIEAHNTYYALDQVPEYWAWLHYQSVSGRIKMPREIIDEILASNREDDLLVAWLKDKDHRAGLLLDAEADPDVVQRVVSTGYASDLTDDEIEELGRDPFLIGYALAAGHCVVTTEVGRLSKKRQNRKIPDVCKDFSVECADRLLSTKF